MKKKNKRTMEIDTTYLIKILQASDFGANEKYEIVKAVRESKRIQGVHYNPMTDRKENDK